MTTETMTIETMTIETMTEKELYEFTESKLTEAGINDPSLSWDETLSIHREREDLDLGWLVESCARYWAIELEGVVIK